MSWEFSASSTQMRSAPRQRSARRARAIESTDRQRERIASRVRLCWSNDSVRRPRRFLRSFPHGIRSHGVEAPGALVAISTVVLSLGLLARQPSASRAEVESLAGRFSFAVHPLEGLPAPAGQVEFPANPIARQMGFYLYQIGASAALGDLDGDGLANDLCLTDPRTKSATVSPIPGTRERYAPLFLLQRAGDDRGGSESRRRSSRGNARKSRSLRRELE